MLIPYFHRGETLLSFRIDPRNVEDVQAATQSKGKKRNIEDSMKKKELESGKIDLKKAKAIALKMEKALKIKLLGN